MRVLLLIPVLMLGACAKQPGVTLPTGWARVDGQPINSGLLDIDNLDCTDEIRKPDGAAGGNPTRGSDSRAMVDNFVSCMKERGYVQIKS
jgi:hypothetical protein